MNFPFLKFYKNLVYEAHDEKLARWKSDLAVRAKIQCLMCSFAGVKTSNMARCVIFFSFLSKFAIFSYLNLIGNLLI